ncbi:MAG: hypothetical protein NVSMB62_24300 [Acidobacteriaceae bacterium]
MEAGHSKALTDYLTAMSRFHKYRMGNVLEIARQMPTATRGAGFWTWKNLGRSVNVGAKGIRILIHRRDGCELLAFPSTQREEC